VRSLPLLLAVVAATVACDGAPSAPTPPEPTIDARLGGAMTVFDASSRAFGQPAPTLSTDRLTLFESGDGVFDATFVPAPAPVNAGLGPRFDNVSCGGCHVGDGRGRPPAPGEAFNSMLFRVSVPGIDAHGGPAPVPGVGTQLELRAVVGLTPIATVAIAYHDTAGTFSDGTPYALAVPTYTVVSQAGPLPSSMMLSPRVAPPNFGLGLLEAVPEATIVSLASAPDATAAGVAGHPNYVWDPVAQGTALGRFGLKANTATLLVQSAGAFNADMGVTSSVFPAEPCQDPIPACAAHPPDLSGAQLGAVAAYVHTLAVPARRNIDAADVRRGEQLFVSAGCALCHVVTLQTGSVANAPEASNQTIHPFTDLLLHDMGPGLADNRPDFLATGREWRTPPLWGLGLTGVVNGHTTFLHDGRARSVMEAILWHGGQGTAARESVRHLSASDREALLAFLNSL